MIMAACNSFLLLVFVVAFFTGYVFAETNTVTSFTVDLINRDSSKSPFYNPLETSAQRVANAFHRSLDRVNRISAATTARISSTGTPQSTIIEGDGDYLMKYSIGTPPVEILGLLDTGSDIIWLQCEPCEKCYNQTTPIFDPSHSKSYRNLSCSSSQCQFISPGTSCSVGSKEACKYSIEYGDLSTSEGDVAFETLTFGSSGRQAISFPNTVIGCGHNNSGQYDEKTTGIVGFGYSEASLVSQLNSSIDGKFSYCLVTSSDQTSKLIFGDDANSSSSANTVVTPLILSEDNPYYSLTMDAISVGNKTIMFSKTMTSNVSNEGNIIIDSGTTLTYIPKLVNTELVAALETQIKLERVEDPNNLFSLCFKSESDSLDIPVITAHFRDADVKLQPLNTFIRVSDQVICFVFVSNDQIAIFGNIAQMDFQIAYDIQKKTVSFTPKDCNQY